VTAWPNTFSLGDVLLDRDDAESFRVVSSAVGWDDGTEVRAGLQDRVQQSGSWDATGFSSSRKVALEGFVQERTGAAASALKDDLTALDPRLLYPLQVIDVDGVSRASMARVTGAAVVEWVNPLSFRYTIEVTAPDPLKYGSPQFGATYLSGAAGTGLVYPRAYPLSYGVAAGVTPGSITAPNAGTAPYWPGLRIDGPVPNPVVTLAETGDWVKFNGTVLAGQWLDFDLASRRVLLNGQVSVRQFVSSSGSWLAVPPGGGSVSWAADAADPAAKLSVWSYEGAWS